MFKLVDFLSDLTDPELAAFVAYRYLEFQPGNQKKIKEEIKRRNLDGDKLSSLYKSGIENKYDSDYTCPRCKSNRYFLEVDHEIRTNQYFSREVIVESNMCQICGYNPTKRKPKNFIDALKIRKLKRRNTRHANPNEKIFKEIK